MFGKRKILKTGEQAEAIVLNADRSGYSNSHGIHKWHLKLRVKLVDGTIVDTDCSAYPARAGDAFSAGDIVPVRYDPKYPGDVEVDSEGLVAARMAGLKAGQEGLIKMAEERLAKDAD
jgi:hypothetical protein